MTPRAWLSAALVAVLAVAVAGCGSGGSDVPTTSTGLTTLTIYSALPINGTAAQEATSTAITNGEKLALAQASGKVGPFTIRYVSLDDTPQGAFNAGTVVNNAREAVQDRSTIVYLGDQTDEATKLSLPVLNEAGILQVSPTNQDVGLTRTEGADVGEPDKYYPTGKRTYGRVIPSDFVQAKAQAVYQQGQGCTATYVVSDGAIDGSSIAKSVAARLQAAGVTVAGNESVDVTDRTAGADIGRKIRGSGANCVFFGAAGTPQAATVLRAIHTADPTVKLFGPSTLSTAAFARQLGSAGSAMFVTTPFLAPDKYPALAQTFYADYRKAYGVEPGPEAIYGYEAMSAALQAIRDAGAKGNNRQAVIDAFFKIHNRDSVLGTYSIDRHGDTTLDRYGSEKVVDGKLVFDQVIDTG